MQNKTDTPRLLRQLAGRDAPEAWAEFLEHYSPVVRQVILLSFGEPDAQADCFVFVCEALAERGFRRLRKFDPKGAASFATWLRAVVRNLCRDWHRRQHGRFQPFTWTRKLGPLQQQVFHYSCEKHLTVEQTFAALAPTMPGLTLAAVETVAEQLSARLSPREHWLLSSRQAQFEPLESEGDDEQGARGLDLRDRAPDPEQIAMGLEQSTGLGQAMARLAPHDQLLLRLRFEEDLTLQEIARLENLKDAQTVDRRIRDLLDRLRGQITSMAATAGKG